MPAVATPTMPQRRSESHPRTRRRYGWASPASRLAMAFMLAVVFSWLLGLLWRQDRLQLD
ncbi:hypothetical protein ACFQY5_11485 [Paeniroseomonas aquatica]|uniref:hypothetical protein n=1 Tax=Paeniroseomonas aquatica TaxID=373043 RepID=UPI00361769B4